MKVRIYYTAHKNQQTIYGKGTLKLKAGVTWPLQENELLALEKYFEAKAQATIFINCVIPLAD